MKVKSTQKIFCIVRMAMLILLPTKYEKIKHQRKVDTYCFRYECIYRTYFQLVIFSYDYVQRCSVGCLDYCRLKGRPCTSAGWCKATCQSSFYRTACRTCSPGTKRAACHSASL